MYLCVRDKQLNICEMESVIIKRGDEVFGIEVLNKSGIIYSLYFHDWAPETTDIVVPVKDEDFQYVIEIIEKEARAEFLSGEKAEYNAELIYKLCKMISE